MDLRSAGTPDKEQGGKEAEEKDAAGRPLGRQHCRRVALVLFAEAHVTVATALSHAHVTDHEEVDVQVVRASTSHVF